MDEYCFGFTGPNFTDWVPPPALIDVLFPAAAGSCFQCQGSDKPTACSAPDSTQTQ